MKARIKFAKYGVIRFIGHLDLMRYFQKAVRRAGIDIAYSEGYNPHQIMSFASPLGLGITSDGEYLDIALNSDIDKDDIVNALNAQMVDGVKILDFVKLTSSECISTTLFFNIILSSGMCFLNEHEAKNISVKHNNMPNVIFFTRLFFHLQR